MIESRSKAPSADLFADLSAALVVFLVALPLCLGIALASNAPLFSGLLAGIVGGVVVGAISKSQTSVSGPAAGLTAVVAAQIASLGSFQAFLLAVVIAGALQVGLGVMRAGSIAAFVPSAVIKGLLAAIGLLLILKQIPHLLGHDNDPMGDMAFQQPDHENTFTELANVLVNLDMHWGAALVGALSIGTLILWDKSSRLKHSMVPAPLLVVLLGVGLSLLLPALGEGWRIGANHLVQVPVAANLGSFLGFLQLPDFTAFLNPALYVAAVTIAIVASLETMLNLEAVDKLDPQRRISPPNRELIAQGVGNMTSGLIGGLPVTSVIIRSSVNINAGGKTKLAAVVHGVLLFLCVAFLPTWLNQIPLSCLAAVLIMTGFKLASPKLFRDMWRAGHEQFLPFIVTVLAIVLTDLLIGILIGLTFGIAFILRSNVRRPVLRTLEQHLGGEVLHIELANQVSFLNRVALSQALDEAPRGSTVLIDARASDYIDADVHALIREYQEETAPARGVQVSLVGFKSHYAQREDHIRRVDLATRELQERLSPDQVVQILRDGNERFRSGQPLTRNLEHLREDTAHGRHPLAVVLSGSSSRTPVEMIFDVGLGEIFCARNTGNVAGPSTLGSLEYACAVAGAKVILILGHSDNKAVRIALERLFEGPDAALNGDCIHLDPILRQVQSSVDVSRMQGWRTAPAETRSAWVDEVSRTHVRRTLERIVDQSPVLKRLADDGQVKLVGGMYDVRSGEVSFFTADGDLAAGVPANTSATQLERRPE